MFALYKMSVGETAPFDYLVPTASETFVPGEALVLSSGKATKASGTTAPTHIAVGPSNGNEVPVVTIQDYMQFATVLTAAGTSLVAGNKVTLATDGLGVTATVTSGVAEIVEMMGTAVGDTVIVKF